MTVYYNEIEPFAAEWLRNLIRAGHIAPGDVDERSIEDVRPDDLRGYAQCHFFAGIGVWSHALRSAGWSDDLPVWTGSCPCQPFSAAGKGGGFDDERHLWPAFFHLIRECRPERILGEQVASKDGLGWLDLVSADLEGEGYACGAVDTCAAGFGAPHIRQRLYWMAHALSAGRAEGWTGARDGQVAGRDRVGGLAHAQRGGRESRGVAGPRAQAIVVAPHDASGGLAYTDDEGPQGRGVGGHGAGQRATRPRGVAGGLAYSGGERRQQDPGSSSGDEEAHGRTGRHGVGAHRHHVSAGDVEDRNPGPTNGFWRDADWLGCRDAKWRPVEPGTFPLAYGAPARVGRLRAYGNGLVAPQATAFVEAAQDILWPAVDLRLTEDIFS